MAISILLPKIQTVDEGLKNKQTNKRTNNPTNRQINKQSNKERKKQTNKQNKTKTTIRNKINNGFVWLYLKNSICEFRLILLNRNASV